MTGTFRLAYHGVPRVFIEKCQMNGSSEDHSLEDHSQEAIADDARDVDEAAKRKEAVCKSYLKKHRININIRQVHKPDI